MVDFNLQKAKAMGADIVLNSARDNVTEQVMALTGGLGVGITFLAFGNASSVQQAAEITVRGGTVSDIAVMENGVPAPFSDIQIKELKLCGSNMYTREDFETVIHGIDSGAIQLEGFITQKFPIEQFHEAMEFADKRPQPVVKAVLVF